MKSFRKISLLFLVLLLFFANIPLCSASEIGTIPLLEKIDFPFDLNFTVSNTCSGHAYFMQATADELGNFAVYSRHVDPDIPSKVDFKKVYIDVYQSDGTFLQELSFTTALDLACELKENSINIYFFNSVLIYDLATQELLHYAIPEGAAVNGGLYKQLRSNKFTAGNWEYSYENGINGYVKLIRSDGDQVHVLLEMPGTGNYLKTVIFPGSTIGIVSMIVIIWLCRRRQCRKHTAQE